MVVVCVVVLVVVLGACGFVLAPCWWFVLVAVGGAFFGGVFGRFFSLLEKRPPALDRVTYSFENVNVMLITGSLSACYLRNDFVNIGR